MVLQIIAVESGQYQSHLQALFWEYVVWNHALVQRELGLSYDVHAIFEQSMNGLLDFAPPRGRLLLAQVESAIVGCAGLRSIGAKTGEVKRMYVRPQQRRQGIGRALLEAIVQEARQIGYAKLRLDCACFLKDAQALYRSTGFCTIEPYAESEIPEQYRRHWVFMEKFLA